ncbi:LacI family DNA-binding transcriptional regulator [Micropruina sonneratiae]|uniref:LacI family DNA-binding transcriptional regulator n=1 Tax=Micropruina sonneratiae TaxID=2986940 RepID=UPI002227AB33|nr:LacI family DNA-binding transcriptional regulator [Micropruina sp. KQZ13P-5]MCW3158889.1 LacI family DNA-binding transcriptional regulator [Micropruina sp. KQZ13P-5]
MKQKRVTLADVARLAGVSPTAASLVLNDRPGSRLSTDAATRIRAAAAQLDYRPNPAARSLRLGKTQTVAFLSDDVTVTRYASAMIRGLLDVAEQHRHTVLIAETGSNPRRVRAALAAMLDRQPDALVFGLMGAKQIDVPPVPAELPVVLINSTSPLDHPCVLPAEYEAGQRVARVLLEAGHRDIALIGYDPESAADPRKSVTIGDRYAGILDTFAAYGVEPAWTYHSFVWEPQEGYAAMQQLIAGGVRVTALLCLNDRLAFGAYQAMAEHGLRVPDDISVASFDDDVIASYLRPGLTTAAIPYEEMGRRAMAMLLSDAEPEHLLVHMPLRVRESVREV